MNKNIPKHLQSTYNLLASTFPNGIEDEQYFPVLSLLHEHMSFRALAEITSLFTGKDYGIVLNDIYRVASPYFDNPSKEEVEKVNQKLLKHGFEDWINED